MPVLEVAAPHQVLLKAGQLALLWTLLSFLLLLLLLFFVLLMLVLLLSLVVAMIL